MRYSKINFAYLFVFLLFLNCSNSSDDGTPARTFADVQQDFAAMTFNTGINDVSLLNTFNFNWDFRVIMPDVDFTNNNRPLIVTLHGFSGGDVNAHKNTACYAEPGFEALNAIIISPNGGDLDWFNLYNQEQVLSLVELASDYLPVDVNKVVINGYSDGGNGSWWLGESRGSTFSAAIPMASAYASYHSNGAARTMPIPFYVIHGENDELFSLADIQSWIDETNAAGSDVTLEIAPGLTHIEPCSYVPYLQNAANWLVSDVWY